MNLEGIRALLVEDNPGDARLLREAISEVHSVRIQLVHVTRLSAALETLSTEHFDVILLDLSLPDEHGIQTLVRTHAHAPTIPIVVLTGLDDEALATLAVREGAQDYLVKGEVSGNLLVRAMRYASERKHAVESLQRREEHFRSLIENALDLISIYKEDGTIRYVSPSHERVLGYKPDDLIGTNVQELLHAEDAPAAISAFRQSEATVSIECRFRHKDGSWRVLESFGRNLSHVAGVQGIVVNSRDVTERKHVEEALRDANQTLRAVIQTSPLPIYSMDLGGRVKSWNRAAYLTFGWPEWELLGKPLPHIMEAAADAVSARLQHADRGENEIPIEIRCQRRDGALIDVNIWSALLRDASGAIKGVVDVVADVTERKRLEEKLLHSQKMEAVGRLAGGVAHDFNNLLMIISGYTQMLLDSFNATEPLRPDLEEILKAADRASDLTKRLLSFSRRQLVNPTIVDMNSLVADMDRMLRRVIGEDVELVAVLTPDCDLVRMDRGQIEQVVLNLAVNARDAMPQGGKLTIETANVHLGEDEARKYLLESGGYATLSVSDTGEGLSPEAQAHLFEPFFTTKEQGKGTGLGLSTSYGIIKQNGGDIWVHSAPDQGATFKILLPTVEAEVEPDVPEADTTEPALDGNECILLVEDEDGVRQVLATMLKRHGYSLLAASSPREALVLASSKRTHIDLLITDIVMPEMSGPELAEKIGSVCPEILVLFISGYTGEAVPQHASLDGAPFLQKPFPPNSLALKVREILRGKGAAKA